MLWIGLITNNGFVDANKRTATYAMERWLDREGFWLRAEDDAIKEMAVAIANKRCDIKEVAAWLRANAVPREKGPG